MPKPHGATSTPPTASCWFHKNLYNSRKLLSKAERPTSCNLIRPWPTCNMPNRNTAKRKPNGSGPGWGCGWWKGANGSQVQCMNGRVTKHRFTITCWMRYQASIKNRTASSMGMNTRNACHLSRPTSRQQPRACATNQRSTCRWQACAQTMLPQRADGDMKAHPYTSATFSATAVWRNGHKVL